MVDLKDFEMGPHWVDMMVYGWVASKEQKWAVLMAAAMVDWRAVSWVPRLVARRVDTLDRQLVYSKGGC